MSKTLVILSLFSMLWLSHELLAKPLTFGVVPQQSAKRLAELWTPIMQHISQKTGQKIVFKTAKDIPTFEARLKTGDYDIAYMNPYHYVVFHEEPGYQAIAKQKNKTIKGVIVAKVGSDIQSITDLHGKTLAFPAPAAFAASILPRAELKKQGIVITPQYVSSHDSVYLNVSRNFFPAGGGIKRTLNNTSSEVKSQLKVIWETAAYTPHAIATHPRVDSATQIKITDALVLMNLSSVGQVLFKSINFNGIEAAKDSDWNDVRALSLNVITLPESKHK
jgi:phosphonate transport system substrate-binding protein